MSHSSAAAFHIAPLSKDSVLSILHCAQKQKDQDKGCLPITAPSTGRPPPVLWIAYKATETSQISPSWELRLNSLHFFLFRGLRINRIMAERSAEEEAEALQNQQLPNHKGSWLCSLLCDTLISSLRDSHTHTHYPSRLLCTWVDN